MKCIVDNISGLTKGNHYNVIERTDKYFWVLDDKEMVRQFLSYEDETIFEKTEPKYYNNENGSLYLFAQQQDLNAWEFDIIKRVVRCRKKGNFEQDLEKTKYAIDLYLKEYGR